MCDCKKSYGWMQSHSSCWADTILMSLLIPSLNKHYFIKFLKKLNLNLDDFFPCNQIITNCEKEYLIRKIWGKTVRIDKPSITHDRLGEILHMIHKNNKIINDYNLRNFKPKGNMFCILSENKIALDKINNFILQTVILSRKSHVVCIIRCDDNKWYYYDNERAKSKKKLKLFKLKFYENFLFFNSDAILYYYLYTKQK